MIKVAINGFGRIGRLAFREMTGSKQVKTVSWYDNEMSFVAQMIRTATYFSNL